MSSAVSPSSRCISHVEGGIVPSLIRLGRVFSFNIKNTKKHPLCSLIVASLPGVLRRMLGPGSTLPRTLFTDRGTGMYSPMGMVVHAYADAVASAGFRLCWGANAAEQAPDMGDLLLQETAVAWFRGKMRRTKPTVVPWEETRAQWAARASRCVKAINSEYNAKGFCAVFPARLRMCTENEGERLAK